MDGDDFEPKWPEMIEDVRLIREVDHGTGAAGLRVKCPLRANCRRYRSLKQDVAHFGPRAPQYFLGCWLRKCHGLTVEQHRGRSPPRAEIKTYVESLKNKTIRATLQTLVAVTAFD